MKKIKLSTQKLQLNKKQITSLTSHQQEAVKGGSNLSPCLTGTSVGCIWNSPFSRLFICGS
jgi:hypothetical protein